MLERMRRALTRPRGEAKRRRSAVTTPPIPVPSAQPTAPPPRLARVTSQQQPDPHVGPTPGPTPVSVPVGPPSSQSNDATTTAAGPPLDSQTHPAAAASQHPQTHEGDINAQSAASVATTASSFATPARASVINAATEADVESEHFFHAAARAAVYTAYTDALHKEARSSSGGVRRIVELLREHERNPVVVENAALAIAVLGENDAATRDVFGQYGAVEALLYTLTLNERIPSVVERVIFAITNLVRDSPRNVRLLETFDGVAKLAKISSSKRFEANPKIAVHALTALAALKNRLGLNEPRIVHKGQSSISKVITYVLRSMRLHEYRVSVQEAGLDAVRTLVVRADRAQLPHSLLTKCVRTASGAFKFHGESKDVQWQTLALQCDIDDVRDGHYLVELDVETFFGALRGIVAEGGALRRHPHPTAGNTAMVEAIGKLIERALTTASRVGWRSSESKTKAIEAGAVDVCLETLAAFSDDRGIVERTCSVMRSLFDSREGRARLDSVPTACAILSAIETTCKPRPDMLLA